MLFTPKGPPTPERPAYTKVAQDAPGQATTRYMIVCDEGWRTSIVCEDMYGHVADWLLRILGHRPFTTDTGGDKP